MQMYKAKHNAKVKPPLGVVDCLEQEGLTSRNRRRTLKLLSSSSLFLSLYIFLSYNLYFLVSNSCSPLPLKNPVPFKVEGTPTFIEAGEEQKVSMGSQLIKVSKTETLDV